MQNKFLNGLFRFLGHQNWLNAGIRDRLIRWYCHPSTVESYEFVTNFFGLSYPGNLNNFLDWIVYFYGAYERELLLLLQDALKDRKNPVFIDVGANVGQHSLFMSRLCETVHSFEPNPSVRKKLQDKINLNKISNIFVHDVGLGVDDAKLPFFLPKSFNKGTGSFIEGYSDNNEEKSEFEVVNGDRYISKFSLQRVDLIKIDVEGFEKKVLIGLQETLRKFRPILTIEFSRATKNSFSNYEELLSLLPENYGVKKLQNYNPCCLLFNIPGAKLKKFDFDVPGGNLFLAPLEIGL